MDGKVFGILLAGLLIGGLLGYGLAPRGVSQAEYQSVEKKVIDLQNQLSDLQGKVQGYENQINQLQSELSKYKAKATALESKNYTVMIAYDEKVGYYLTDGEGRTLYYFAKDIPNSGKSSCYGPCAEKWPAFSPDHVSAPSVLDSKDFSYIERSDGTYQLAYKGWPLYYFFKDEKAGDTNGEDVKHVWYVMRDYDVMIAYQEGLGTYLTDDYGRTLYYFAKDSVNMSACSGECLQKWPPFYRPNPVAPSVIQGHFGELNVNGVKFTTFKGYPLYYFFKDERRGEVNGQGVKNVWFVVNPFNFR
ncbi:hypothetical protein [Thermococcus sp.]|uniref:hypothetical protein n=1 Tax=Thermococcus sp. TaxID=35749 RepID=UPI00262A9118|nr:hypothetical protein [Thermococcus sp.]